MFAIDALTVSTSAAQNLTHKYDLKQRKGALHAVRAWAAKGYQPVYLSGRQVPPAPSPLTDTAPYHAKMPTLQCGPMGCLKWGAHRLVHVPSWHVEGRPEGRRLLLRGLSEAVMAISNAGNPPVVP